MLLILSVLVTSLILYFFFKSFFSVFFTLLVIFVTVICTGGTIVLLDYKVTLLTGILPALIIIISIPNCIYMYNKYHQEFKRHGNKIKAVSRIIEKVGFLTFMTNINTAVGFFVLYFTDIVTIKQFGVSAGILSVATFLITLIIIPTLLLFLPAPSDKQLRHLDMSLLKRINGLLENIAVKHRSWVYAITVVMVGISVYGISKLKTVSYMVDDLPENSSVKTDLAFFEQHFKGVMPLEIVVDLKKKKGIMKLSELRKLEEFETYLLSLNNISPPLSILNVVKGATQAFYGGHPEFYTLPSNNDRPFILQYFGKETSKSNLVKSFVDTTGRYVRFTCKVADLGTIKTRELVENNIKPKAKEIFGEDREVKITGTTLLFLRGNEYLIDDLTESLIYALVLIALMMVMIFSNPKMILISLIPNIIPMVITAGVMGLFNIPLKPSTALIFGISFGISIDSTIHYLSKYKQELAHHNGNVMVAVTRSIQEAGVSMIYTSVVLFCGFIIFIFSSFGGTVALGMLTSLTLFFAMFTNLTLLPALLLTFRKGMTPDIQIGKGKKGKGYH
jgi:predicted RND superfamily exporter protein